MRIAFDAKRAFANLTGLGNYSRFVVSNLHRFFPENEYLLFSPDAPEKSFSGSDFAALLQTPNVRTIYPSGRLGKIFSSFWRTYSMGTVAKKYDPDVYHGLSNELPQGIERNGLKTVVTIHDVIFMRYPNWYNRADRIIYEQKTRSAVTRAGTVLAASLQTKTDLIELLKADEHKIQVAYQDCSHEFYVASNNAISESLLNEYGIEPPFMLCVSKLDYRKNHLNLLAAFARVQHQIPHSLVLIGSHGSASGQVLSQLTNSRVIHLPRVPTHHLPYLYDAAAFSVYPSFFEGFGIPLLESLRRGKAVLSSTDSCFSEVAGTAGMYARPDDPEDIAYKIEEMANPVKLKQLEGNIPKVLSRFDRKTLATQLMQVYSKP